MEIQLLLILIACIINFEFTFVQADNQSAEKYQNLFNSIAKLEQEAARERQAFDAMKEDFNVARNRNAYKKKNFYKRSNIDRNFIVSKREADEHIGSSGTTAALSSSELMRSLGLSRDSINELRETGHLEKLRARFLQQKMEIEKVDLNLTKATGQF